MCLSKAARKSLYAVTKHIGSQDTNYSSLFDTEALFKGYLLSCDCFLVLYVALTVTGCLRFIRIFILPIQRKNIMQASTYTLHVFTTKYSTRGPWATSLTQTCLLVRFLHIMYRFRDQNTPYGFTFRKYRNW
jgi:hypothetical protein